MVWSFEVDYFVPLIKYCICKIIEYMKGILGVFGWKIIEVIDVRLHFSMAHNFEADRLVRLMNDVIFTVGCIKLQF